MSQDDLLEQATDTNDRADGWVGAICLFLLIVLLATDFYPLLAEEFLATFTYWFGS